MDSKSILNKLKEDYNNIALKYSQVREKEWKEMDFLFDKILEKERVLDLGCGNGRFYPAFEKRKANYYGIDFSSKLIELAKEKYPLGNFSVGDAFDIKFEDEFFDKVYSIAVLHHMPSKELRINFLKELVRVLKKQGLLILTVWDLKEKKKNDENDVFISWYGAKDCYFHIFTLEELEELIIELGLKIIEKGEIIVGQRPYNNFYIICQKND
ncbi:MAG: hypothetical protein MCSN_6560 [Candidatus Microsyncoccus archaeolyticus]|jgi:alkylated DNA repair protein alkB family protein 8|nr:MAG: hypothetical protein MCSN_6560 [Candidatus Parcubacteria bacterium]